jgi:hypothetical protein
MIGQHACSERSDSEAMTTTTIHMYSRIQGIRSVTWATTAPRGVMLFCSIGSQKELAPTLLWIPRIYSSFKSCRDQKSANILSRNSRGTHLRNHLACDWVVERGMSLECLPGQLGCNCVDQSVDSLERRIEVNRSGAEVDVMLTRHIFIRP